MQLITQCCERLRRHLSFLSFLAISVFFAMPAQASNPAAGTPADLKGVLRIVQTDDFARNRTATEYSLEDAHSGRRFKLRFSGKPPKKLRSGSTVRIKGNVEKDGAILLSGGSDSMETISYAASAVTGNQNTLVIIANFTDSNVTTTAAQVRDLMFTDPAGKSVDAYYRESSNGLISVSGNVAGPYTLNYSSSSMCDLYAWGNAADAAALAHNINPESYTRVIYVLPSTSTCSFAGAGEVGASPSRSWIFRSDMADDYAHELGHNLNMGHSATLANEYGDVSDIMGAVGFPLRQNNAPHKEQMGWVPSSNILTATQSAYYEVAALELNPATTSTPQIIKIAKPDTGEYYYFSYRQPIGFDSGLYSSYIGRVSVHRYPGDSTSARSYLLQLLGDNSVFQDASNGITVTMTSHTSDRATLLVELSGSTPTPPPPTPTVCTTATPALSLSPSSQTANGGTTLSYTATITNNDSTDCAESSFSLTKVVPGGWVSSISPASLTLSPGDSANATLSVTSGASTVSGTYDIHVYASDSATTTHSASASGNYTVQGDVTAPTAPTGLAATTKRSLIKLSWNPANDNVAVAGYEVWRNGNRIASPTDTRYSESVADGSYTYSVIAFDAMGNRSTSSNAVTVTIGGSDKPSRGKKK